MSGNGVLPRVDVVTVPAMLLPRAWSLHHPHVRAYVVGSEQNAETLQRSIIRDVRARRNQVRRVVRTVQAFGCRFQISIVADFTNDGEQVTGDGGANERT